MSIEVHFNTDDFCKYMKNVGVACDNFTDAITKYLIKKNNKEIEKIAKEYRKDPLYKELEMMFKEGDNA